MNQSLFIPWKGRVEVTAGNNTISFPVPTTFGAHNPSPTGGRTIDLGGENAFRTILPAHLDKPFRYLVLNTD
jgi:hypothetical protein